MKSWNPIWVIEYETTAGNTKTVHQYAWAESLAELMQGIENALEDDIQEFTVKKWKRT